MNYLENYYANYDEEGRLASNHGQVEYLTTMKYIHEVIDGSEKKKILEVGAGTGRYSIKMNPLILHWCLDPCTICIPRRIRVRCWKKRFE